MRKAGVRGAPGEFPREGILRVVRGCGTAFEVFDFWGGRLSERGRVGGECGGHLRRTNRFFAFGAAGMAEG